MPLPSGWRDCVQRAALCAVALEHLSLVQSRAGARTVAVGAKTRDRCEAWSGSIRIVSSFEEAEARGFDLFRQGDDSAFVAEHQSPRWYAVRTDSRDYAPSRERSHAAISAREGLVAERSSVMMKRKNKSAPRFAASKPIADKLIRKMRAELRAKVVSLGAVVGGKQRAEALQQTVATHAALAELHPAHAVYVYAQNQTSVMSEQLTELQEMDRFSRLLGEAEEEYMPEGPPISPLTNSFFTCWAFFDACIGSGDETLGTTTMAVGKTFGMDEELVRVIGLMQDSRMGVYVCEGMAGNAVVLRELVTNHVCRAVCPSGYAGRAGELWYARVLPPPIAGSQEHVVFTTPYLLVDPGELGWLAYFDRTLPSAPAEKRLAAYARHMKWGPTRKYWTEFVFEAYDDFRPAVIFLKGLPDVPESRPHSRVNS